MAFRLPTYLSKPHKASLAQGWKWEHKDGSKHVIVRDPRGEFVVCISLTAYDGTVTKRVKSKLKNAHCPGVK